MSSYNIVIDSSTRKNRGSTHSNSFVTALSTPIYGTKTINFVSASMPYINNLDQVNDLVNCYYVVIEVPNFGIVSNYIHSVDNEQTSTTDVNRFDFAYTGSLAVPRATGNTTNYLLGSFDDRFSVEKTIPIMESIKISIYYFDTSAGKFELYPFGTNEEYVIKISVNGTKDKLNAMKTQEEEDKRIEVEVEDDKEKPYKPTFATKLINYYRNSMDNKNLKEEKEPVGALLPKREFMGIPTRTIQIIIPIAIIVLVIAFLLAKNKSPKITV